MMASNVTNPLLSDFDYVLDRIRFHGRRLGNRLQTQDLDDLMQDAFLSFLRERHRYEEKAGSPKTFIGMLIDTGVARHLAVRQRHQNHDRISMDQVKNSEEPSYNMTRRGEMSRQDRVSLAMDIEFLITNRMSQRQQLICRMLMNELSVKSIARKLSVSLPTVYRELVEIGIHLKCFNANHPS